MDLKSYSVKPIKCKLIFNENSYEMLNFEDNIPIFNTCRSDFVFNTQQEANLHITTLLEEDIAWIKQKLESTLSILQKKQEKLRGHLAELDGMKI